MGQFNGSDDFFDLFHDFLTHIFENIRSEDESATARNTKHLTLAEPPAVNRTTRIIHGYFSSGISGDEYTIVDTATQDELLDVQTGHAAYRKLFFYISIPPSRDSAALVLQRKAKYGIKGLLDKALNRYIREQGYSGYKSVLSNVLHGRVYTRMIDEGKLSKVELIKRRIPSSIEQYYENGGNLNQIPGTFKTSIMSPSGLPQTFKNFVHRAFSNPNRERIEIEGIDDEFDEIEFELELNGKKKSFYVAQRHKIQPDVDVTHLLEIIDNVPTTESFVVQAEELIRDIIDIRPADVVQN